MGLQGGGSPCTADGGGRGEAAREEEATEGEEAGKGSGKEGCGKGVEGAGTLLGDDSVIFANCQFKIH